MYVQMVTIKTCLLIFSDLKRNEFLHKLILKLDLRQHYFISSFMLVRFDKSYTFKPVLRGHLWDKEKVA